eukprot:5606565-Pyramimonas_sp.AAC.1
MCIRDSPSPRPHPLYSVPRPLCPTRRRRRPPPLPHPACVVVCSQGLKCDPEKACREAKKLLSMLSAWRRIGRRGAAFN